MSLNLERALRGSALVYQAIAECRSLLRNVGGARGKQRVLSTYGHVARATYYLHLGHELSRPFSIRAGASSAFERKHLPGLMPSTAAARVCSDAAGLRLLLLRSDLHHFAAFCGPPIALVLAGEERCRSPIWFSTHTPGSGRCTDLRRNEMLALWTFQACSIFQH